MQRLTLSSLSLTCGIAAILVVCSFNAGAERLPLLTNFSGVPVPREACGSFPGGCVKREETREVCWNAKLGGAKIDAMCAGNVYYRGPFYSPTKGWGCGIACNGTWKTAPDTADACLKPDLYECALLDLYRIACDTDKVPLIACGKGTFLDSPVRRSKAGEWSCSWTCVSADKDSIRK